MKRFLSVLLAFSMVFSILAFPVGAAETPSVEITSSQATLVKSSSPQEVTLSVVLHNPNPTTGDVSGISFDLKSSSDKLILDTDALTLTEAFGDEDSATYNSPRFVCIKMSGLTPKPITETEVTLMTIKATLTADAPVGSYTISTDELSVSDTKSVGVFNTDVSVTINVVEEITSEVTLTGITTTPAKGVEDKSALTGDNVTVAVSWNPALEGGKFAANTEYTATITVSPGTGYAFGSGASVKLAGVDDLIFTKSGGNYVGEKTFPITDSKSVTALEITTQPTNKTYADGDAFDPTGMVVKATFDDSSTDANYTGYTVVYVTGTTALKKGDTKVTLTAGAGSVDVTGLTVNGKVATAEIFAFTDPNLTYTGVDQAAAVMAAVSCTKDAAATGAVTYTFKQGSTGVTEVKNAGSYTLYAAIAGGSEYEAATDIKIADFAVTTKAITESDFTTIDTADKAYTATQITPTVTSALTVGTDYTVVYGDNKNAGTGTIAITGAGNYNGTINKTFTITPITLTAADLEYTGDAITKVYDGGTDCSLTSVAVKTGVLKGGDTLAVTGTAVYNTAGVTAAKVVFTPTAITTGNYRLAASQTLEITASITPYTAVTDETVTGTAGSPIAVIKDIGEFPAVSIKGVGGETATGTVAYSYDGATAYDDVKAKLAALASGATAEIGYTFTGTGNYAGASASGTIYATIVDVAFTVGGAPATASNAVTLKTAPVYGDSWSSIVTIGSITAKVGDTDDDGTGVYSLNVSGVPDAGADQAFQVLYSGTIGGMAYTDVLVCIGTASVAPRTLTASDLAYTGPALTKAYDGTTASSLASVSVKESSLVGGDTLSPAGSAVYDSADVSAATKVTFTPAAITTGNYRLAATETIDIPAAVTKKTVTVTIDPIAAVDYDGTAKEPVPTVKVDDAAIPDTSYTVAYSGNTNAGTASVTIGEAAGGNYTFSSVNVDFTINKATYTGTKAGTASAKYGTAGAFSLSGLSLPAGYVLGTVGVDSDTDSVLDGAPALSGTALSFAFKDNADLVGKTAAIKVPVTDSNNYLPFDVIVTVTVSDKLAQVDFKFSAATQEKTYGDDLTFAAVGAVDGSTITYDSSDPLVATVDNTGKVQILKAGATVITATAGATDTHESAAADYTLTVSKADLTVRPKSVSIYASEAAPALAVEYVGLKNGDVGTAVATLSGGTLEMEIRNAADDGPLASTGTIGVYKIIFTGSPVFDPSDCYSITTEDGSLTISTRPSVDPGPGSSPSGSAPAKSDAEKAVESIEAAKPGDTVKIELDDKTEIGKEILEAIAGKDITVEISIGEVVWVIEGADIPLSGLTGLDLGVRLGTETIPVDIINAVTGEKTVVQLTLKHDGPFGFPLVLQAPLGKENAGFFANLYYYNNTAGKMEFRTAAKIDGDGKAKLVFTRASEYAIVIDNEAHGEDAWENPFTDVIASAWYYADVEYAVTNGLFAGTSATTFSPNVAMTRGMLVTVLGRMAGIDPTEYAVPSFDDTPAGAYYTPYVSWAAQNNIVTGYNEGTFGPDDYVTREQFALILYRYAGSPALNAGQLEFGDAESVSTWAWDAMVWATAEGIITGKPGDLLDPKGSATRAEAAAMLRRYLEK